MKEIAVGFAQLIVVIMMMITLAVSTATVAQWADAGAAQGNGAVGASSSSTMLLSDAAR